MALKTPWAAILLLCVLWTNAWPVDRYQQPLQVDYTPLRCDRIGKYTTDWFLLNTLAEHRREIHSRAIFYTRGAGDRARRLACDGEYVTLWDIWPKWLYDSSARYTNVLSCIHANRKQRTIFYENMSRAYAYLARSHAMVVHGPTDYDEPPLDGIWGRIELPTIRDHTDIESMWKVSADRSLNSSFHITEKPLENAYEASMSRVQALLRQAESAWRSGSDDLTSAEAGASTGSCTFWTAEESGWLDGLF